MERIPEDKLKALALLPGAARVINSLEVVQGAYLVGGAVRDLLLGFVQIDYDIAYEGDARELAAHLAQELNGTHVNHDQFMTATVSCDDGLTIDIATTRSETYEHPGALPTVERADIATDLARRDFSVNAMAMALWAPRLGELTTFPGADSDLVAHLLRVMHDESFTDDPTRLLRLVRYGARLGFTAEPHTEDLARAAVQSGAMSTVSGVRIGDELLDLLGERAAAVGAEALSALELDIAIHPHFKADEYLAARALLNLDKGVRQDLLLFAVGCFEMPPTELDEFMESLELPASSRKPVADAVQYAVSIADEASKSSKPSEVAKAMKHHSPEAAALAIALPDTTSEARASLTSWLSMRSEEHLLISGSDLIAAGVAEGPEIGRALAATLDGALDGELTSRDQQLEFALDTARSQRRGATGSGTSAD